MGKLVGSGLFVMVAMWAAVAVIGAAAAMIVVVLLALGCTVGVFVLFYQAAEAGKIHKWPLMFLAFVGPMAVVSVFGAISWNTGIAQSFTQWVYGLDGLGSLIMLLVLYLGVYGFAVVVPTFGAFYSLWAVAKESNNIVFAMMSILSALAGFLSGGWGHLIQGSHM